MALIKSERRCGNTTRQVDEWIQELFEKGSVVVVDHAHKSDRGVPLNFANEYALKILKNRMYQEHGFEWGKEYNYSQINNTLKFKK